MRRRTMLVILLLVVLVAFQPACKRFIKPTSVLLFDESTSGFAEAALDNLAIAYTKITDYLAIPAALAGTAWDLIVFDNPNFSITDAYSLLYDYVTKGGRLVISTWKLNMSHPLWGALGYTYVETITVKMDVLRLNKSNPLWWNPFWTTDLYLANLEDDYYGTNSQPGTASGSGTQFATVEIGNPAKGVVFVANSGRTILNAFLLDDGAVISGGIPSNPVDSNSNGTPDAEEWWTNEIKYVCMQPGQKIQPVMPTSIMSVSEGNEVNSR